MMQTSLFFHPRGFPLSSTKAYLPLSECALQGRTNVYGSGDLLVRLFCMGAFVSWLPNGLFPDGIQSAVP